MKILTLKEIEGNTELIKDLKSNKTIIFPTETIYGLSTNAYSDETVKKVYQIKGRNFNKPLIILINNYDMLNEIIENVTELEKKIMNKFWPGPLTIFFKQKENSKLSKYCNVGTEIIGVRMTSSKIASAIISGINMPLVSTSANKSGEDLSSNIDEIIETFKDEVDYFIKEEITGKEKPSTIVQVQDNEIKIIREGAISKDEILSLK